jgi:hypothetical protein
MEPVAGLKHGEGPSLPPLLGKKTFVLTLQKGDLNISWPPHLNLTGETDIGTDWFSFSIV